MARRPSSRCRLGSLSRLGGPALLAAFLRTIRTLDQPGVHRGLGPKGQNPSMAGREQLEAEGDPARELGDHRPPPADIRALPLLCGAVRPRPGRDARRLRLAGWGHHAEVWPSSHRAGGTGCCAKKISVRHLKKQRHQLHGWSAVLGQQTHPEGDPRYCRPVPPPPADLLRHPRGAREAKPPPIGRHPVGEDPTLPPDGELPRVGVLVGVALLLPGKPSAARAVHLPAERLAPSGDVLAVPRRGARVPAERGIAEPVQAA
mmetsp:Transcript_26758/g.46122  ORF Transcript_26758/g.46122 Transcript_26758/m.46122 type:complete len:260 (-) Transcript_26758:1041-1820(-)